MTLPPFLFPERREISGISLNLSFVIPVVASATLKTDEAVFLVFLPNFQFV